MLPAIQIFRNNIQIRQPHTFRLSTIQLDFYYKTIPVVKKKENPDTEENHTGKILEMRKKGMQSVEIAKALGVGLGEVNLVLGLYKGDTDS